MRTLLRRTGLALVLLLLLLVGPPALLAGLLAPRVVSPTALADSAVESGITRTLRRHALDGLAANMGPPEAGPHPQELRKLLDRHVTQAWVDSQLLSISRQLADWKEDDPRITVDLSSIRASLVEDEEAVAMIVLLAALPQEGAQPADESPEITPETLPELIPQEILVVGPDQPDRVASLQRAMEMVRRVRLAALGGLALVVVLLGLLVLLARSRLKWLGAAVVLVSAPVAAASLILPNIARREIEEVIPELPPGMAGQIGRFLDQMLDPVLWASLVGTMLGVVLILTAIRRVPRERHLPQPAAVPVP